MKGFIRLLWEFIKSLFRYIGALVKQVVHYITYLIFIIGILFASLVISDKVKFSTTINGTVISVNQHILSWMQLGNFTLSSWSNYSFIVEEKSDNNVSDRLSFLSILTTLMAAFFIYSSWKIDNDLRKIDREYEKLNSLLKQKTGTDSR